MLSLILILPILGIFLLLITPANKVDLLKKISLLTSFLTFFFSLFLWLLFDNSSSKFQFVEYFNWVPLFNIHFFLGVDGISLFFIILSTLLVCICILSNWVNIKNHLKSYLIAFLLIDFCLVIVFSSLDIIIFYIFFESILIPMFIIIGVWGSRTRKLKAAYLFFLYTLFGSLLMLFAIFYISFETGTTDFQLLNVAFFSEEKQVILWLAFFISFAVKVPMVPFHIWLPEAHVEAPTAGSVILAGILLKMGTYGLLRYSLCLFPYASIFFSPFIYVLSIIAIVYGSLTTLRQTDLKKIIAYSSIAHMGFVSIGIFSFNFYAIEGSLLIMLSHGFISSALFLCIGILYDKHHTRVIKYYSGLCQTMPIYSFFFLFFSIANLSFPGTSSFAGEFLILIGSFQNNTFIAFFLSLGMVLSAAYSLWLPNRLLFGPLRKKYFLNFTDVNFREVALLLPLFFSVIWLGLYPEVFLETMHLTITNLLQKI